MRVLHLHSGNLFGGVETFLLTLARWRHAAASMEMAVGLCFEGRVAGGLRAEGVDTFMLGEVRFRRPDQIWRARHALRSLLAAETFDVAVCHQSWPLAVFGPGVKRAGLPLVSWVHMPPTPAGWVDRIAARVDPDHVICNSRFTASRVSPQSSGVDVIYLPVDPGVPRQARPGPRVVIVQVSRMEAWKGQRICLEALAQLRDEPTWECWQVGGAQRAEEQQYFDSLREQAAALGIGDRVSFLGHRSDVRELLARADIFCQPNLEPEAFGISFVEALYAGLPVVASAIGGALEIVDDSCGVLVPPADAGALASALRELIANRARREALGARGPARASALCDPVRQVGAIAGALERVALKVSVH